MIFPIPGPVSLYSVYCEKQYPNGVTYPLSQADLAKLHIPAKAIRPNKQPMAEWDTEDGEPDTNGGCRVTGHVIFIDGSEASRKILCGKCGAFIRRKKLKAVG